MTRTRISIVLFIILSLLAGGVYWYGNLDRPQVKLMALPAPATYVREVTVPEREQKVEKPVLLLEVPVEGPVEGPVEKIVAYCTPPGDGYSPTPEGTPPGAYVAFQYPLPADGLDEIILPMEEGVGSGQTACAMVTYDIDRRGIVVNAAVYNVAPEEAALEVYYTQAALKAVENVRYAPGTRNGKAIRVNQNVIEVRFE